MKLEHKRIFISDLPETVTPIDLEKAIQNYGNVTSVEIKERKELGLRNNSLFFAYINVNIDDRSLQQCFKDFGNGKWCGQRIAFQIARESFLDRLKKERESTGAPQKESKSESSNFQPHKTSLNLTNGLKPSQVKKHESTDSEDESNSPNIDNEKRSDSSIQKETKSKLKNENKKKDQANDCSVKKNKDKLKDEGRKTEKNQGEMNEPLDIIIKNNKGKILDRNGLRIESVGKSPILIIDNSKKNQPSVVNSSEANLKRLQSLNNLKKAHKTQQLVIKQALSKVDSDLKKRIIFDASETVDVKESVSTKRYKKASLFEEDVQEDDFEPNFEIKEQFQGKKGQKLLELQAKYKNDKRFVLDERFMDENEDEKVDMGNNAEDDEDVTMEDEKRKEYEILEQVLGKKVLPLSQLKKDSVSQRKVMLRYDPAHPNHSKFEIQKETKKDKKKRKRDALESEILNEKKQEEKEAPEVSKEVFYKVTDDLQNSLKETKEFSLLSMFGKAEEKEEEEAVAEGTPRPSSLANNFMKEKNPFRYDSSDDEDETDDIPNQEETQQTKIAAESTQSRNNRSFVWSEPFFFTDDDYRLQEGVDFVTRLSTKEDNDFAKVRRELKQIVKAKVRNNQRKNRPFKKKLGGSKKKKMLRMKRALKR